MFKRISRLSMIAAALCAIALMSLIPGVSAQDAQSLELVGTIEAITVNTITVNQQEVFISGAQLNVALQVGALVQVEGTLAEDGSITAREVNAAAPGVQVGEAELVGTLDGINGALLVVNGQMIDTTGAQAAGALTVGQWVRVHAVAVGPNLWRAREIAAVQAGVTPPNAPVAGEFEIVGVLQSIDGATVMVSGQVIDISGAEIKDALVVGTQVKVHVSGATGALVAREIELAAPGAGDDNSNANANGNANANDNSNSNSNSNGNLNDNAAVNVPVTVQQAIEIVRRVYPSTRIRSIELTTAFGGTVVWEVETGERMELLIDAQTGNILVIERSGRGGGSDDNFNGNSNSNGNFNSNSNGNSNSNDNSDDDDDNGNFNSNSNSNDNSGGDDDDSGGDDDGGMGGMG
ncbi:MAG: PepSY domain-containing protein [Chloroflexi bacterium]|nr:PepSY domain-containing protein [Chloroflexota bacterium]